MSSPPSTGIDDPRDVDRPMLVAHRGYPARYPENSTAGLEAALDAGARFVEFDVQLSADGVAILSHDDRLERIAGCAGRATELTWAGLQQLDVGEAVRLGGRFPGTRMPSLRAVVDLIAARPGVHAFVELKRESLACFGVEAVVDAVAEELAPLHGRVTVISFVEPALRAVRGRLPGVAVGLILAAWDEPARAQLAALEPEVVFINRDLLPPAPQPLWVGPWRWAVYTVDEPNAARALAARGVDYVETDCIGEMLAGVRRA